jgi:hypothetical protein
MLIKKFNESQDDGNELEMHLADLKKLGFNIQSTTSEPYLLNGFLSARIRATKKNYDINSSTDAFKSLCNKLENKYTFSIKFMDPGDGRDTVCRIEIDLKNK